MPLKSSFDINEAIFKRCKSNKSDSHYHPVLLHNAESGVCVILLQIATQYTVCYGEQTYVLTFLLHVSARMGRHQGEHVKCRVEITFHMKTIAPSVSLPYTV